MLGSDAMRGYNDLLLLQVLSEGGSYGYKVAQVIRERTESVYSIKETTLYSALTRLERNGLIQSYSGDVSYGKPRLYFRITGKGTAFLKEKWEEWHEIQEIGSAFEGRDKE